MLIIQIAIVAILGYLVLRRPYLGLVFTAASLPVVDLLPSIAGFTSLVSLLGVITLAAYWLHKLKDREKSLFRFGSIHILGLLFIGWMFISNPQAGWFGVTRNWVFTFLQLWVLIWLTGELLDTPDKHHVFMWAFSIATIASALFSILRGRIGADISSSWRDAGLADNANAAARYFVVGLVFLSYLRTVVKKRLPLLLASVGVVFTFLGVFFTVSRTGILLLFSSLGLLFFLEPNRKYKFQLVVVFAIAFLALWFLSDNITNIVKSIIPSITQGADTVGLRYGLWEAGLRMWSDHILQGVGIGMYPMQLPVYGQNLIPSWYINLALVTHNMYIQVLAETGLIGFLLFVLLLIVSLRNIWHAGYINDPNSLPLRNVWFVVFVVMLLGGITKSDHIDKLVWMAMGVSVYFRHQSSESKQVDLLARQVEVST